MCATVSFSFGCKVPAAVDAQLAAALGDPHGACTPRNGQRRLEHASGEVDAVRRQLGDAVRVDRARKVDGLSSRSTKR
jgi:hypothetical protein